MATREEIRGEIDKVLILATGKTGVHLEKVKQDLSDLGVVRKVDRELPEIKPSGMAGWEKAWITGCYDTVKAYEEAGYGAFEPLI